LTRDICSGMATLTDGPPHVEFRLPEALQSTSYKPTPLRIIKRRHEDTKVSDVANENARPHDGVGLTLGSLGSSKEESRLKISKRHSRPTTPTTSPNVLSSYDERSRPEFWTSSPELDRPPAGAWGEALGRCRDLLSKSTPPVKNVRRRWPLVRTRPSFGASTCRTPSSGSSLRSDYVSDTRSFSRTSTIGSATRRLALCALGDERDSPDPLASSTPPASPLLPDRALHTQPFVLSPCISVTSESAEPHNGQQWLWAAIEVSARLSRIPSSRCPSSASARKEATGTFVEHQLGSSCPRGPDM